MNHQRVLYVFRLAVTLGCCLLLLGIAAVVAADEATTEVGEFSIPEVSPLSPAELARLRKLVRTDANAKALAGEVHRQAIDLYETEPRPLEAIHYEGLVNTDPRRIAAVKHLTQMSEIAILFRDWQATGDERAAQTLERLIVAWAETYQPTGNDVNENKFYPLLVAYHALRNQFSEEDQQQVDRWVRQLGEKHLTAVNESQRFSNRYSKSVRLLAICGMILQQEDWVQKARDGIVRFIEASLYADGSTRDLKHRDSLTYHGSSLKPPIELAIILGDQGRDLYERENQRGGSLKKSVDYVVPYAMGEKQHREWIDTKVDLDRRRAAAGLEKYRPGRLYEPKDARELMELASFFDPALMKVVRELSEGDAHRFPTWRTLENEASR